ncbi:uncharacterized protein LOC117581646 [Drosophila guanche]|uniref:Uncharacterized protein n=1 Tax=Drosophila guanche TaxID=7266 RepID=A0A3B0JEW6_DROGU|nr:uncharacterized protein LOC117581646 [Drosophila guanche]SPP78742.1 Hypothetical predicted protein [Drosophila guanche]
MIRALLSLWSPAAGSVRIVDEAQNQNHIPRPAAQMNRQNQAFLYLRSRHLTRYPRMIAQMLAGRGDLPHMLGRVQPPIQQAPVFQDPDLSESEPDEDFFMRPYGVGYTVTRRRTNFTLLRTGVEEPISLPIIWQALEALEKRKRRADAAKRKQRANGLDVAPFDSVKFVAQFLAKNLTLEVFNAGNHPSYGPSTSRHPPPPPAAAAAAGAGAGAAAAN